MSSAAPSSTTTAWSPLQSAVFEEVVGGSGHLVVEACPGSGKTTTLVEAVERTDPSLSVVVAAFGRETKATLESRLPGDIVVKTWNGFGASACNRQWGRLKLEPYETHQRAALLVGKGRVNETRRQFVVRLVGAGKATLSGTDVDSLDALADDFELEVPKGTLREALVAAAAEILETDEAQGPRNGTITYDDQCWLPIVFDLDIPTYDIVAVDETQDLNAAQLELAQRAARDGGRIVAVGDRRQSIFGFRGADRQAMPRMIRTLKAKTLPLNVCYRCGVNIVAEAARIWPEIVPNNDSHSGVVRDSDIQRLRLEARPGDFVVSRLNAPLISLCLGWLSAGVCARILGRDVGASLIKWIQGVGASDVSQILKALDAWEEREVQRLLEKDRPTNTVEEKAACIRALCEGLSTVSEVEARAVTLFTAGTEADSITLASTHKAKGLEADRVWLLKDTYCRVFKARKGQWLGGGAAACFSHDPQQSSEEEKNLFYVGITRAKKELVYVRGM